MENNKLDPGDALRQMHILGSDGAQVMQDQLGDWLRSSKESAIRADTPEKREYARSIALFLEDVAIPWREKRITALRERSKEDL